MVCLNGFSCSLCDLHLSSNTLGQIELHREACLAIRVEESTECGVLA